MKYFLIAGLIFSLGQVLSAQIIEGIVLDAETQEPVSFASVFFNGTFVGTSSDEQGNFKLDLRDFLSRPLNISAIGYIPYSLENLDPGKNYTVLLIRDHYKIEEVKISGKLIAKKRKSYMRLFKQEFVGLTPNSRRCYIMNEEDISFNYDSDQDTIKAFAQKPLEIHNEALGYHFNYHLESFEFDKRTQSVLYKGSIVFTYDMAWEGPKSRVYKRRRRYAYKGSKKEFIRKLWSDKLKSSGYSLWDYSTGEALKYKDVITVDDQGRKYLSYPGDLEILYYNYYSGMKSLSEEALIDRTGFYDPVSISWSGRMSTKRIADFLPYEYSVGR